MSKLLEYRVKEYVNSPYSLFSNLELGIEYQKENQLASAISHYLRGAEFGSDEDIENKSYLVSECLIHAADCLNKLGGRHYSTKSTLLNAISNEPKMSQSYLLMSKVYEQTGEWFECNAVCNTGLAMMEHFKPMLYDEKSKEDIINEFLFQKAVSNYYVGRVNQAKEEFNILSNKLNIQNWIKEASIKSLLTIGYPSNNLIN